MIKLIIKSFLYYFKANLLVALGVAICTAVLTGALVIGDSVRYSLEQSTFYRLGNTTHLVSATDRFFREELAGDLAKAMKMDAAPVLLLEGMAVSEGGKDRVNKVQVSGVDTRFEKIAGSSFFSGIGQNEVIISSNLAERLNLKKGNLFLLRIKKASLIPLNAPFVSEAETSVSFRAVVKEVAGREHLGFFNLKNSQTAPYNVSLSLSGLNELMKFKGKANNILICAPQSKNTDIELGLQQSFTPEDAGLQVKDIPITGEKEIVSERVFMDEPIVKAFQQLPGSYRVLTYLVNAIRYRDKITPYSFAAALEKEELEDDQILLNTWTANDLGAGVEDTIRLKYYAIGPLRQMEERESVFFVKKIVPMQGIYGDRELMPYLPGLADAKSCKEWEAGVPINLDAIRDKDEAYWNQFKGTPKVFISMAKAQKIWANRFGNYTAIRISKDHFTDQEYRKLFSASVKPSGLGVMVTSVREDGLNAARNGVDFSQLFLGLSFFLLLSAVILISLLFLFNLENRQTQTGTLSILGFTRKQLSRMLLWEGAIISMAGALLGLMLTVVYTRLIFNALNTLWWAVVRTSVLELKINPSTLLTGLIITVVISLLAIFLSVNRSFRKQAVELQRQQDKPLKPFLVKLKIGVMIFSLNISVFIAGLQIIMHEKANPALFFISGIFVLIGLMLLADLYFRKNRGELNPQFSSKAFIRRNSSRNLGRSITVVILFAIGTFLVISTGANRKDIFSTASKKSNGTGGFLYFAETTVPVLYDLNDKERRVREGFEQEFTAVQFSRMSGDDASCLNLNKISNPAVLGVNPQYLEGRFSFDSKISGLSSSDPWKALASPLSSSTNQQIDSTTARLHEEITSAHHHIITSPYHPIIPAIADQTVIQWSLGKKTGDTLYYRNEKGDTLGLKLIAGLSPSIFQGYVLISSDDFLRNYPSSSGSNVFLIDGPIEKSKQIGEELSTTFRDYGWEMTTTAERLNEFNSVTNTYLSIFMALGALGLILGTVGLAIVLARSILERRKEIAILQALGFTQKHIWKLLTREYISLLLWGLVTGFVSSVIAVWPNLTSAGSEVSLEFVLMITASIFLNGLFWIALLSWLSLKPKEILDSLKN